MRVRELRLRRNWGVNYREFKRERSKQMHHYSLMRLELQLTSWVFIQELAPILLVDHLVHVPQPIAMLRNHAWSINQEIGSFIVASAWDQIRQHYPKVE